MLGWQGGQQARPRRPRLLLRQLLLLQRRLQRLPLLPLHQQLHPELQRQDQRVQPRLWYYHLLLPP